MSTTTHPSEFDVVLMPAHARERKVNLVLVSSVALSFISFWRAAAIVLNDMASTVYYIGGISEQAIGKAAPWFVLGVMLFAYAVRAVYVESCTMFTRGGVYRVVKQAEIALFGNRLGGLTASGRFHREYRIGFPGFRIGLGVAELQIESAGKQLPCHSENGRYRYRTLRQISHSSVPPSGPSNGKTAYESETLTTWSLWDRRV